MLELIVLGQIPGTQITVSFQWILAIASLGLGIVVGRHIAKQNHKSQTLRVDDITV